MGFRNLIVEIFPFENATRFKQLLSRWTETDRGGSMCCQPIEWIRLNGNFHKSMADSCYNLCIDSTYSSSPTTGSTLISPHSKTSEMQFDYLPLCNTLFRSDILAWCKQDEVRGVPPSRGICNGKLGTCKRKLKKFFKFLLLLFL